MSKQSKGVVFDSKPSYGSDMYEDAKARLKHQSLLQDYEELQKETNFMRSKLETVKQRKLMLAAEVRFLRRRYEYLVKMKSMNQSQEQNLVQAPNLSKQTKIAKEQLLTRKESSKSRLPPVPELNSKKKPRVVRQVAQHDVSPLTNQSYKKVSYVGKDAKGHGLSLISPPLLDVDHKRMLHIMKESPVPNTTTVLDRNHKERITGANDTNLRNSAVVFDLNKDSTPSGKEASLPHRAPIFDLNEISTGDEDFLGNGEATKLEEAKKSLVRGINEEQHTDLKLSICRNSGESSSRAGKRKISWQDPVALRV